MTVAASQAVLDLSAKSLPALARFAASVPGFTFAQLVVIAGRLDRQRERTRRAQDDAAQLGEAMGEDFHASLADLDTQLAAMLELVGAEMERRLAARA